MQLHYNIIWIDDEMQKLKDAGDLEQINEYIRDIGFTPLIIPLEDGRTINDYLDKHKFDLIISDYNIDEGHHGDTIIKELRSRKIFNEVLFYSSQSNLQAIAEKLLGYDRISFHSGRRGLTEKIEALISLSVSKLLELNATRGLVTAQTSELDVIMEDLVMDLVYNKLKLPQDAIDKIITDYVDDFLKKSPIGFLKKYQQFGFEQSFHRIEAGRKWSIFRALLKEVKTPDVSAFLSNNKKYGEEVIDIRNKFAHAKAIIKDEKIYLAGFGPRGEPFEFDESQCISIRKNLIEHRENFNTLTQLLSE
jgi:hypothetical protein